MKFCKDCRCLYGIVCLSPANGLSPVTGEPTAKFARDQRDASGPCGQEAKLFEPINLEKPVGPANEIIRPFWKFWRKK